MSFPPKEPGLNKLPPPIIQSGLVSIPEVAITIYMTLKLQHFKNEIPTKSGNPRKTSALGV